MTLKCFRAAAFWLQRGRPRLDLLPSCAVLQELLPLVLSFELPAILQTDTNSPAVQHIAQTYNLTVSFKPPARLYRGSGVVRGSQNNTNAVKVSEDEQSFHLSALLRSLLGLIRGK